MAEAASFVVLLSLVTQGVCILNSAAMPGWPTCLSQLRCHDVIVVVISTQCLHTQQRSHTRSAHVPQVHSAFFGLPELGGSHGKTLQGL